MDSGGVSLHMQEGKVRAVPFKIVGGGSGCLFSNQRGEGVDTTIVDWVLPRSLVVLR